MSVLTSTGRPRADAALTLPERLDASTVADLRDSVWLAVDSTPGTDVVVDVSQLLLVDSVGLGLLLSAHRACRTQGRRLVLAHPQPALLRLLAVTRLHRVLHVERAVLAPGA
jgi:anti-sigma B factor antagonist